MTWSIDDATDEGVVLSRSMDAGAQGTMNIRARDAVTGALLWNVSWPATDYDDLLMTEEERPICVAEGCCLYVEHAQELVRRDLFTGKRHWGSQGEQPFVTLATVAEGLVVAGTSDESVSAWHLKDGTLAWKYHLGFANPMVARPLIAKGVVYAGAERVLVALRAEDGAYLWHSVPSYREKPCRPVWRAEIKPVRVENDLTLVLHTTWSGDPCGGGPPDMDSTLLAYTQQGMMVWTRADEG